MTSFLAYQNHVLGTSQVKEKRNQQLFKKLSLKSMFLVKKGKMTRLQLTSLLKNWVLLTNNSTVQISNLFLRLKTETKKQEKIIWLSFVISYALSQNAIPREMVLNTNQVSSKYLKMKLARRYASQVFLYLRHIHFKVRLLTESWMTARLLNTRTLDWRKESLLMMEYAGLEFTRKMVLCLFQSLTAFLSDSISCFIETISSLRSFDSLRLSTW